MTTNITWPLSLLAEYRTNQRHTLQPEHNWRSPTCLRSIPERQVGWRKLFSITRSIRRLLFHSWWNLLIFQRDSEKIMQSECASIDEYRSLLISSKRQIFLFQIQSRVLQKTEHYLLQQNRATHLLKRRWNVSGWQHMVLRLCARHKTRKAVKLQDCI